MAKKKKGISEKVLGKKKNTEKKVNPFEVKLNKQKHDVLGKKATKFDKGAPGLSRSRAMKKRKEKLLKEFRQKDSANMFLDKRLGENDPNLSVEEKMTQRFALEKKKSHEKSSLFNLDEDIELTHYGQSLQEMEQFEAPELSDDDDMDKGNLDADFVSEELFGGFLTKAGEKSQDKPWKERLQEMISKSKKAKHERQVERDQTVEMTEKLDAQWKELQALVSRSKKRSKTEEPTPQTDDYDIAVRELKFEMRGMATDRLKSEEELAQEEVDRLQKLEADRQRRMRGDLDETTNKQTHISADDLTDCYAIDKSFKKVLTYKDGKVCTEESGGDNPDAESNINPSEELSGAENSGNEDKSDEEKDDGSADEDGSEGDSSDADSFADIDSEDEEDEKVESQKQNKAFKKEEGSEKSTSKKVDLKERKEVMEAARKELPYTFEVPGDLEGLKSLFHGHTVSDQLTILQRMKQCNHPSLADGNKVKLEGLFALLLDYVGDLAECDPPRLEVIDRLTPELYDLCRMSPVKCSMAMLQVIRAHQEDFQLLTETRKARGFPTLNVLIHLKLVSVLFPTSDFRHPVVTPAMLFMSQLLTQCPVMRERDTAAGLFLSNLAYEYVASSKRYFPEAVNFIHGLLFLAAEKTANRVESVIPPFKPVGKSVDLLKVKNPKLRKDSVKKGMSVGKYLSSHMDRDSLNTDEFRLSMVSSSLDLGLMFSRLYEDLPSHTEIFQPLVSMADKLPSAVAKFLQEKITALKDHADLVKSRERKHLTMQDKKPQPMKMFEPKIETIFDGKKKRSGGDKEYNERQRLIHKHRREMKGAIREIRRDVQFIAREQLHMQIQKDQERKKRVRDIHQMLAQQEGDFKALKRKKKD